MLLYIIRHGDPIYNPDSLTPKGRRKLWHGVFPSMGWTRFTFPL